MLYAVNPILRDLLTCPVTQFDARVPARKFRTYRCVGSIAAVVEGKQTDETTMIHREYIAEHQQSVDTKVD